MVRELKDFFIEHLFAGMAEASFPALKTVYSQFQQSMVEIGPQTIGEVKFGVRQLPQQKITDPFLAARPDKQIGFR